MTMIRPQKPEDFPTLFAQGWMVRDAKALAGLFVDDADFVNVVGLWWHNRQDIEKAHDYGLRTFFKTSEIIAGRTSVRYLGEDVAVVHVRWKLTGQADKGGSVLDPRKTVMMFVVQKQADGWIAVAAQNTDVIPGMETFMAKEGGLESADYRS